MDARLRKARSIAMAFLGSALVLSTPWEGWWAILVLVLLVLAWQVIDAFTTHRRRPEYLIAAGWLVSVAGIAAGILLTGAADSPAKSWLIVPALSLPARFRNSAIYAGVAVCLLTLTAVTLGADPDGVRDQPTTLIFPAALIAAATAMTMALRNAEIEHRAESVIDQLTGMLNRKALESRTTELELQSRISGHPVGLIVCDIDNFKQVNDQHGHSVGDAVLKDVAYALRKELRAYDLAYRLGGEEFVVLVPGASPESGQQLAERLREAVEATRIEGLTVTASFGVAVSEPGDLVFQALFERADEALYRAKAAGRNRVCAHEDAAYADAIGHD